MAVVGAAISAIASGIGAFASSSVLAGAFVRLAGSLVLSQLAKALAPKPGKPRQPGIKTTVTSTGGVNPQSFILGLYATSGNEVAPPYSHGDSGKTPNAFLTYIHDVGDIAGATLNRLIINDNYVTITGTPGPSGNDVTGRYDGYVTVRYYDGTQTTASSYLTSNYSTRPTRPWTSDMIGRGIPYVVTRFRYKRSLFNSLPTLRYELQGLALYDPRSDTTVGGSGAQRWADPATWVFTENPAVMIYNILRGITLADGSVWGGECEEADLPLANWFAAMNVCDESVPLDAGGTQTRYKAGFEVSVDTPPADVIDELLKACSGQISEFGGVYKMTAGGPAAAVYFFTDDDVIVSDEQAFVPFPSIDETYNAVHASYPARASKWAAKDAPPRYSTTYETEDQNRRLVAELTLPAVYEPLQVQRIMQAYIEEERRFRRHIIALPPDAATLEPLDVVSWTSTANGYSAKDFEIASLSDSLMTLTQSIAIRERDASDYTWTPATDEFDYTEADPAIVEPDAQAIGSWGVTASSIEDAAGTGRRAALLLSWDGTDIDDVTSLRYEIRVQATAVMVATGSTQDIASGSHLHSEGIIPSVAYEVRAIFTSQSDREFDWTAWTAVTSLTLTEFFIESGTPDVPAVLDPTGGINKLAYEQGNRILAFTSNNPGSTSLSWLNTQPLRFDAWECVLVNLRPTVDGDSFFFQVSDDNGTTWFDSAAYIWGGQILRSTAVQVLVGSASASGIDLAAGTVGNDTGEQGINGVVRVLNAESATQRTSIEFSTRYMSTGGSLHYATGGAERLGAEVSNAFRVRCSGGIASGQIRWYGIKS